MTFVTQCVLTATLVLAIAGSSQKAAGQSLPPEASQQSPQLQTSPSPSGALTPSIQSPAPQPLFEFKDSDIKFSLQSLMNVLRDNRHEGWVLAAYPDPKTSRPLIGAGFSLDVMATEHPQTDPLNPHPFVEPSSTQLWQAAGLDPELLQSILSQFDHDLKVWTKKKYRRKIRTYALSPQITEQEATRLLRVSAIQAVENAKAYCRNFDQLTGPQQMALSQLVFQMGVNLEEFVQFLSVVNGDAGSPGPSQSEDPAATGVEHWKAVQRTLIESQWARRYTGRATTVIAMFDPDYLNDPRGAERQVEAVLRPPVKHRRGRPHAGSLRVASSSHTRKAPGKKRPNLQHKRQLA